MFNQELFRPQELSKISNDLPLILRSICLMSPIFAMAFSRAVRNIIMRRDGYKSVLSGETENLEAAHLNHDRNYPKYNEPSNGRMLTRREHYIDHLNRHGRNGLTKDGNRGALNLIWKRMTASEKIGLKPPPKN